MTTQFEKQKIQGRDKNELVTAGIFKRNNCLTNQSQEGLLWKAQENHSDYPRDVSTGDEKCTSAQTRMGLIQFRKITIT